MITVLIPCQLSSNCNTVIKCKAFCIKSDILYLNSINFEASLSVLGTKDFSISNCTIKKNYNSNYIALLIHKCENAHIDHVTIDNTNSPSGLYIDNSVVSAQNLSIHHSINTFIFCKEESFLTLRDSNFNHSDGNGIFITNQISIEIENCHFSDTKRSCFYGEDSICSIKNSTFQNSDKYAIELYRSNDFTIENNHITNTKITSIFFTDDSCGIINNNKISKTGGNGIFCGNGCDVFISNNDFSENEFPAIYIGQKSSASIQSNKITKSSLNGIAIRFAHHAEVEKNELNEIELNGISSSDCNSCFIHDNKITNCKRAAVDVFNNTNVKVENNIIKNVEFAFIVSLNSSIVAKNNEIENVKEAMACLFLKGGGEFVDNKVSNCLKQNKCETTSSYLFSNNGNFPSVTNDFSKKKELFILDDLLHEESQLCLRCKKNKRECFSSACGHKIFCIECAGNLVPEKNVCPICNQFINMALKGIGNENEICGICYENKADCMIVPCGHIGFCSSCMKLYFKDKKICPMCRRDQSAFIKLIDV